MKKLLTLVTVAFVFACGEPKDPVERSPDGEPNETVAQATPMTPGTPVTGTCAQMSDLDVYRFTVPAGGATVRIRTFDETGADCDPAHLTVDTFVKVYDGAGSFVMYSDDSGPVLCESFDVALEGGTSYVEVSGFPPFPFVYTLMVDIL